MTTVSDRRAAVDFFKKQVENFASDDWVDKGDYSDYALSPKLYDLAYLIENIRARTIARVCAKLVELNKSKALSSAATKRILKEFTATDFSKD